MHRKSYPLFVALGRYGNRRINSTMLNRIPQKFDKTWLSLTSSHSPGSSSAHFSSKTVLDKSTSFPR